METHHWALLSPRLPSWTDVTCGVAGRGLGAAAAKDEDLQGHVSTSIRVIPRFIALCRYCALYKLKVCGNPAWSKSISARVFQKYLLPSCVSVAFWQFLQYFQLCHDYYTLYGEP